MSPRLLAANCSYELVSLMKSEPAIVDAVKVSEFNKPEYIALYRELRQKKPLVLHGLGHNTDLGTGRFDKSLDRQALELAVSVASPSYISVHLLHWIGLESVSVGPIKLLERLARDVELIREITGLPVVFENSTLETGRPGVDLNAPFASDAGFIGEALAATGTQLLLDLAHAQITAWHLGNRRLLTLGASRSISLGRSICPGRLWSTASCGVDTSRSRMTGSFCLEKSCLPHRLKWSH